MPKTATRTRSAVTTKTAILVGAGIALAAGLGYAGLQSPLGTSLKEGLGMALAPQLPPGYAVPGYGSPGYRPPGYTPPGYTAPRPTPPAGNGLQAGMPVVCEKHGWAISKTLIPLAKIQRNAVIKGTSGAALYWLAPNGKRYVSPNENTYRTWYPFGGPCPTIQAITDKDLARFPIGGTVHYRPFSRLIKITTDPKVYITSREGVIHHIATETLARQIFGTNWKKLIDDMPDAFFTNYKVGSRITTVQQYRTLEGQYGKINMAETLNAK